jgi:hypothetical protein
MFIVLRTSIANFLFQTIGSLPRRRPGIGGVGELAAVLLACCFRRLPRIKTGKSQRQTFKSVETQNNHPGHPLSRCL